MSRPAGNRRLLVLILALAGLAAAVILMARSSGTEQVDSWQTDYAPTGAAKHYAIADVQTASRMNVTVYDDNGQPQYLGWSGGSEAMESFTSAISAASPVDGEPDETFADLIVFYFKDGDSMALTYSRQLDLLMYDGQLYQPTGEIGPLIVAGEERYN